MKLRIGTFAGRKFELPLCLRPHYQVSSGSLIAALIVALLFHLSAVVMDPNQKASFPLHEAAREGKSKLFGIFSGSCYANGEWAAQIAESLLNVSDRHLLSSELPRKTRHLRLRS